MRTTAVIPRHGGDDHDDLRRTQDEDDDDDENGEEEADGGGCEYGLIPRRLTASFLAPPLDNTIISPVKMGGVRMRLEDRVFIITCPRSSSSSLINALARLRGIEEL